MKEPIPPTIAEHPADQNDIPPLAVAGGGETEGQPPSGVRVVKVPKVKMPVMKKVPIKIPAGMVKIPKVPKMPGIIRVKIPKPVHQGEAPVPPKPEGQG